MLDCVSFEKLVFQIEISDLSDLMFAFEFVHFSTRFFVVVTVCETLSVFGQTA